MELSLVEMLSNMALDFLPIGGPWYQCGLYTVRLGPVVALVGCALFGSGCFMGVAFREADGVSRFACSRWLGSFLLLERVGGRRAFPEYA